MGNSEGTQSQDILLLKRLGGRPSDGGGGEKWVFFESSGKGERLRKGTATAMSMMASNVAQ